MLQDPISEDLLAECGGVSITALQEEKCSSRRTLAMLPEGSLCIGSGAFGTVRLGWVQERRYFQRRSMTRGNEEVQLCTIVPGTCAAVAVKRVAVQDRAGRASDFQRQQLIRELQVMERIRMHPHPNVVQCWGFLFGYKDRDNLSDAHKPLGSDDDTITEGEVLTSLTMEWERWKSDNNGDGDEVYKQILNKASYVDLCLSLCAGGSLEDYVRRKATSAARMASVAVHGAMYVPQANKSMATSGKTSLEHMSFEQGLTGSTTGGTLSCGGDTGRLPHASASMMLPSEGADCTSECVAPSHASDDVITAELAIWERDIVAILYALVNGLRHTHEVLMTLHRDIKPANVLICDGVGRTPVYALQALSSKKLSANVSSRHDTRPSTDAVSLTLAESTMRIGGSRDGANSVKFVLFSDYCSAMGGSTVAQPKHKQSPTLPLRASEAGGEKPATLVVPLTAGKQSIFCRREHSRPLCIEYLPQAEGWRIQLADFGISSGVGQVFGSNRCGTFPFMAPEVLGDRISPPKYDTAADIYSLGVTLQYVLVHLVVGGDNATRMAHRRIEALGARWIDEDDMVARTQTLDSRGANSDTATKTTETETETETEEKRATFIVPNDWRCERELRSGMYIRGLQQRSCPSDDSSADDMGTVHENSQPTFTIPRSWRCRDELVERRYVRQERPPSRSNNDIHAHLLAPLPDGPSEVEEFAFRVRRKTRCRSCGKYHRHLVELLNAMTATQPSQRPTLSTILQSAAIIEQGSFVSTQAPSRGSDSAEYVGGGGLLPGTGPLGKKEKKSASVDQFLHERQSVREGSRSDPSALASRIKLTALERQIKEDEDDSKEKGTEEEGGGGVVEVGGEDNGDVDDAGNSVRTLLWRPPSLRFLLADGAEVEGYGK